MNNAKLRFNNQKEKEKTSPPVRTRFAFTAIQFQAKRWKGFFLCVVYIHMWRIKSSRNRWSSNMLKAR